MPKNRFTVSLNTANYDWVVSEAATRKNLSEVVDGVLQERRVFGPVARQIEGQVARLAERLDRTDAVLMAALDAMQAHGLVELKGK